MLIHDHIISHITYTHIHTHTHTHTHTVRRAGAVRSMGGGHHDDPTDHQDMATIDPKWFDGLEEGVPIEHPLKVCVCVCVCDFVRRGGRGWR